MMQRDFDIQTLLGGFPSHAICKGQPGIYEMKRGSRKVDAQSVSLVRQLFGLFPARLLWLKDVDEDLKAMLGRPLSTAGGASLWVLTDRTSLTELFNELYEGGWAMFFLPSLPQHALTPPEFLSIKPDEIRLLLRKISASVGILSWYDDIEWLIVSLEEEN